MTFWKEFFIGLNNAFDLTVLALSIFFIPFAIFRLISINKESKERERKGKEKKDKHTAFWKKEIAPIFLDLSDCDRNQLISNLKNEGDDLYLLFRFPSHKLSQNNVNKINEILDFVFDTHSEDRYLYSYFEYWIKDFVIDVMLPVLTEDK